MATANLHINGFYAKCSKVTGRHPPYLVGSKGHESGKIFYVDANARYPYRTAGLIALKATQSTDLSWETSQTIHISASSAALHASLHHAASSTFQHSFIQHSKC